RPQLTLIDEPPWPVRADSTGWLDGGGSVPSDGSAPGMLLNVRPTRYAEKRCMDCRGSARYRRPAGRSPAVRTRRCPMASCAPEELRIAANAIACAASRPSSVCVTGSSLLGVGLILSHRA